MSRQRISQFLFTLFYNPYFYGFMIGTIYQGRGKILPCPGFNCHSCPSAILTCPIGALQLFVSFGVYHISFYLLGFLATLGVVGGRLVCGWACPFGLIQDMLYKIRSPKMLLPKIMSKAKYFILVFFVLCLAFFTKEPWFCKLCPVGTLEAGIPLVLLNGDLRQLIGNMFYLKITILISFIALMIFSKRPFCQTACPLGAIYSLFNKISFIKLEVNREKCIKCGYCTEECPVSMKIYKEGGSSTNCIRCFRCTNCPTGAIKLTFSSQL